MNRQLATFSLLSTQWQKYNKSYLDNFVPLFSTLLLESSIKNFEQKDYVDLAQNFKEMFELTLPPYLISSLVAKLLNLNIVTKEREKFIVNPKKIIERGFDVKKEIDSCKNKQNVVFEDFVKFCAETYQKSITLTDANRIILSFIKESDLDIILDEVNVTSSSEEMFLIGKYVSCLFDKKSDLYKDFVDFAMGSIAFNAMYLAPIDSEKESLKKCVFFLDSSFIFPLLGIDSVQREEIIKLIIKEIYSKGGTVRIYQHTFDEIVEILQTAIRYIESPYYDPRLANKALSYLRQEGFTASRVELILASLKDILTKNKITVEYKVPNKRLGIDEDALYKEITNNLSVRQYDSVDKYAERTIRDINSIIYTYEKRQKINSRSFVDAKYSFITENALLTTSDKKIVGQYCCENKIAKQNFFPAAIPEAMFCAYLYLGSSNKAVNNVNMSVLATAFAAIRPNAELEALVKDQAMQLKKDNKISEEAYNLVITSHLIKDCLAERTLTSYEQVNEDTIFSLIEDAKNAIGIEERDKRKTAETKWHKEQENNERRKNKARRRAKIRSCFVCSFKYFVIALPYIISTLSFFDFFCIELSIIIFGLWTLFCFIINHICHVNLKSIWINTYKKQLDKAFTYFELDNNE